MISTIVLILGLIPLLALAFSETKNKPPILTQKVEIDVQRLKRKRKG